MTTGILIGIAVTGLVVLVAAVCIVKKLGKAGLDVLTHEDPDNHHE
jgi:hypothetical protein